MQFLIVYDERVYKILFVFFLFFGFYFFGGGGCIAVKDAFLSETFIFSYKKYVSIYLLSIQLMIPLLKYLYLCPEGFLIVYILSSDLYHDVLFLIPLFLFRWLGDCNFRVWIVLFFKMSHSVMICGDSGYIIFVF